MDYDEISQISCVGQPFDKCNYTQTPTLRQKHRLFASFLSSWPYFTGTWCEMRSFCLTKLCAIIKVFTLSLQRFVRIPSPIMPKSPHALYRESQAQAPPPKRRGPRLSVRRKLSYKHLQPFHNPHQFSAYPRSLNCVIVRNSIRQKTFKSLNVAIKSGYNLICTKPKESRLKTQASSGCLTIIRKVKTGNREEGTGNREQRRVKRLKS